MLMELAARLVERVRTKMGHHNSALFEGRRFVHRPFCAHRQSLPEARGREADMTDGPKRLDLRHDAKRIAKQIREHWDGKVHHAQRIPAVDLRAKSVAVG